MTKLTTLNFNGWNVTLKGKILTVTKDGEIREYIIKEKHTGMEYAQGSDYFYIRTDEGFYYQFKFEVDNAFIGDKFTDDDDFVKEFACYQFGVS